MEYRLVMSFFRYVACLGFGLIAACDGAWAQTVNLANGNFLNAYGLTATIGNFSCPSGACSANDKLTVVASGRGTITFEVVNSVAGSAIFSNSSTSSSKTMSFNLVISRYTPYSPTETVSGAALTTVGYDRIGGSSGSPVAQATAAFSGFTPGAVPASTLTDALVAQTSGPAALQTIGPASNTFAGGTSNSFTVLETLTLNSANHSITNLAFNSIA